MEGNLSQRRDIRRPEPRRILRRDELAHSKPVSLEKPTDTHKSSADKGYSKVTPIYASSPKVPRPKTAHASALHKDTMVAPRGKKIHRVTSVGKLAVEPVSQRNFELLLAAELAGDIDFYDFEAEAVEIKPPTHKKSGGHTHHHSHKSPEPAKQRTSEFLEPLPSHSLTGDDREMLHKQFQYYARRSSSQARRAEARAQVSGKVRHHARKIRQPRSILAMVLVGVLLSGAYAAIDSFNLGQSPSEVLAQQGTVGAPQVAGESTSRDTGSNAPAAGDVAPDLAKTISIPKIDVKGAVISVGLTPDGAVDTPRDIMQAAWYNKSSKPGQPGQAFINGHASSTNGALFGRLEELEKGDKINIEMGDGSSIQYRVVKVSIVDRHEVDMAKVLQPYDVYDRGLTLLTCDGEWIPEEQTLANRVIVWAVEV